MEVKIACTVCGTKDRNGQWWGLQGYYGLSGNFCPKCYDKVSHDSYGKPNNPSGYKEVMENNWSNK